MSSAPQPGASRGRFCLNMELDTGAWRGPRRMEPLTFGTQGPGTGVDATILYGVRSARVDEIVVTLAGCETLVLDASTSANFPGLRFFAPVLPTPRPASVEEVVALDTNGTVLLRRSTAG